jgi:DNA-binding NarL/FixJ family response regulator
VHIVVVDPLPLYQHGTAAVLSAAGYEVDTPSDVLSWLRGGLRTVVVLTLDSERAWRLLHALRDRPVGQHVIAVVLADSVGTGIRAMRAGAQSVLHRSVTPAGLRRAVDATVDGQAVLPAAVAAALATGLDPADEDRQQATAVELAWLRQLAAGVTVAQLAVDAGYSERAMFRRLQSLYRRLGVRTRIEAIVLAQQHGWLDLGDVRPGWTRSRRRPR